MTKTARPAPIQYPKWVYPEGGTPFIVQNHVEHSRATGKEFGPDGKEVVHTERDETAKVEPNAAVQAESDQQAAQQQPIPIDAPKRRRGRPRKTTPESQEPSIEAPEAEALTGTGGDW